MRAGAVIAVVVTAAVAGSSAYAAPPRAQSVVERSSTGTVIQPTRTIIHDRYGHTTVIVVPRRRSYLDTGTEVSPGDRKFMDYMLPPGGDPGRPNWFMGPDLNGTSRYPLPGPGGMQIPGLDPTSPF